MGDDRGRSLAELLSVLQVVIAADVRLSRVDERKFQEDSVRKVLDATPARIVAFSMYACTTLDVHEARTLCAAGALPAEGTILEHAVSRLSPLWSEVDRMARGIYGDNCGVLSSRDDSGKWRASVSSLAHRGARDSLAAAGLTTHFEVFGEDEHDVLLEVAAFVSAHA